MVVPPPAPVLDERYEIGELIGRGSMGEVHHGWDRRLDRPVAVKCLRRDLAADTTVRARFEEEARSAGSLAHPVIVTVFDTGECDGVPFIVMERLPGRTLADDIAAGPLPADEVAAIGADLAGALAAAHAAGVLHRDVKPANVLRDDAGGVKLADFGIAKSAESASTLTVTGTVLGSPAYLAPERLEGTPASEATDVYSLAVVLYEALTGERAFAGDTPVAVAHAVHTQTPVPLAERMPGLDPGLARAIDRAMAREPELRPRSAAEFAALLHAGAEDAVPVDHTQVLPVASTSTTVLHPHELAPAAPIAAAAAAPPAAPAPAPAPFPTRRRRPNVAALAAIAAVVVVLLLGWLTTKDDGDVVPDAVVDTTATTAPADPLPAPLDDALDDLEESIDP